MDILVIISFVFSLLIFIGLIFTAIISYCEKEIKAFHKSFWTALLVGISFIYLSFNSEVFTIIFSIAFIMISLLLLIPFGRKSFPYDDTPLGQIDERDTMFSRSELTPGTKNYIDYYELYPEKEKLDNIWRQKPGLLSRDVSSYNRFQYAAADASFVAVSHFRELVDKTPLDEPAEIEPARICPGNAISYDKPAVINGIKRWQINQEKCYDFWCRIGTDCGRCVAVCPYSHPDNVLHNSVRFGIINSPLFRLAAVKMDDVLYGAKPPTKETPPWLEI